MSQMVMRTHPSQDLAVGDEQSRVRLFDRIRSRMRTRLSRPVFARGTAGGPTRTYRDIGYSEGAREWVLAGGELRDRPAINVKFLLAPEDA